MKRLGLLVLIALRAIIGPDAFAAPTADGLYAEMTTTQGAFWCRLDFQRAPRTVANFIGLADGSREWIDVTTAKVVKRPYYDGLTFHRVIDKFMIQGGSRNGLGTDGPGYLFADEFHAELKHAKAGTLSMANSGRNSNGSQFFITVTNTPWLDGLHSVFGEVVEGLDLVHTLSKVPVDAKDKPVTPIVLTGVRIVRIGATAEAFGAGSVTPPLPDVGVVPIALVYSPGKLDLRLQARTNHIQHAFFTTALPAWQLQTFKGFITNINAASFLGEKTLFFRVLDGGVEP